MFFDIGLQGFETTLDFQRFILSACQALFNRRHLLRLAVQPPTRPLGFNLQFSQFAALSRQGLVLGAAPASRASTSKTIAKS